MERMTEIKREQIARIIFMRMASQVSGTKVGGKQWRVAYSGWIENPALFPIIEACVDAAEEILNYVNGREIDGWSTSSQMRE